MDTPAYHVELCTQQPGCSCCGAGKMWDIVGPDGIALSRSWADQEEAEDFAEDLSSAFNLGRSIPHRAEAPVGALEGTFPIVLYFTTKADRDELAATLEETKPHMRAVKI